MTLSTRDAETERLVRALARRKNISEPEAVRLAVAYERERIAAVRRSIAANGAVRDELWG